MLSAGNSVSELDSFETFRLDTCDSEASGMSDSLGTAKNQILFWVQFIGMILLYYLFQRCIHMSFI